MKFESGICSGCRKHCFTLVGGYCDWCRADGTLERDRLKVLLMRAESLVADGDIEALRLWWRDVEAALRGRGRWFRKEKAG